MLDASGAGSLTRDVRRARSSAYESPPRKTLGRNCRIDCRVLFCQRLLALVTFPLPLRARRRSLLSRSGVPFGKGLGWVCGARYRASGGDLGIAAKRFASPLRDHRRIDLGLIFGLVW